MRRDMDLVRSILIALADSERPLQASDLTDSAHSAEEVGYHLEIMAEGGLVNLETGRPTWKGQDFLAAASNERVWNDVRRRVAPSAVEVSFEVYLKALDGMASRLLGL